MCRRSSYSCLLFCLFVGGEEGDEGPGGNKDRQRISDDS